jgi:hypothetical protein
MTIFMLVNRYRLRLRYRLMYRLRLRYRLRYRLRLFYTRLRRGVSRIHGSQLK